MSYLDDVSRELTAVGIRGRRRARIVTEFADHIECNPQVDLGRPRDLAYQFADELGTTLARRAAYLVFAALAVAAVLSGVALLTAQNRLFVSASSAKPPLGEIGACLSVLGGQVALVAGGLAMLRAFRRREATVLNRDEAVTILRRAAVGIGAGIFTMLGFGLTAVALVHKVAPNGWTTLALSLTGAGMLTLLAASPAVLSAGRLRPVASGSAGDIYEDLGPLVPPPLRDRPWRFAVAVALVVALLIALAGVAQSDPFDGILRGLADGVACLAGFALLGRYLGLRS